MGELADIDEVDLACLLGNLLDNALEALSLTKEPRLELCFFMENANRVISCKNSIAGSVLDKNKNLLSTKSDKSSHGFGIPVIRQIVAKYDGMCEFYEEDSLFCVTIVLPNKD